jgi:S-adenosylmethionine:tRNA ribosyltransferase-isomerase
MPLTTSDFDYPLDEGLIAQQPLEQRDASRLMVLERAGGPVSDRVFSDLPELLSPGDLMVINDTRVIPARFFCRRASGGRIEALFLRELADGQWEVMLRRAGRCRSGERLGVEGAAAVELELRQNLGEGNWLLAPIEPVGVVELLQQVGQTDKKIRWF